MPADSLSMLSYSITKCKCAALVILYRSNHTIIGLSIMHVTDQSDVRTIICIMKQHLNRY